VCGERRVVPAGLRIVSCVKCGRALGPPLPAPGPRPAIFLLAAATNVTQLVSGIALGLAIASAARHFDASAAFDAWLIVPLLGIFAGGKAYRGSPGALVVAAMIDTVIVAVCLVGRDHVIEMLHASGALRYVTVDTALLTYGIAALAGVAGLACLAALPQARRYAAWRHARIAIAFRTWGV
jgi:hypothetical protein